MGRKRQAPKDGSEDGEEDKENTEEVPNTIERLMSCMEAMMKMMKETMEKQMNVLQREIFDIKTMLEKETEKRRRVLQENEDLKREVSILHAQTNALTEKIDNIEQDKLSNDIVLSNVNKNEVSSPREAFKGIINRTLMTEVVKDSDICHINTTRSKDPDKITIIATLNENCTKMAILKQRKMFAKNRIFVKENLTKNRYKLFTATKKIC